jgi:hypothetical protein
MLDCPSVLEIERGMREFRRHEPRDAMYRVATFWIKHFWGDAPQIADGLGVLLLTWNNAFYRFGSFDFDALERCIRQNQATLDAFRNRDIASWSSQDDGPVSSLFKQLSTSLRIRDGPAKGRRSPVAVAKAMHVLAPAFFPIWDNKIAATYACRYNQDPSGSYLKFARSMQRCVRLLKAAGFKAPTRKTMLKVIDEYNYATFTKGWI